MFFLFQRMRGEDQFQSHVSFVCLKKQFVVLGGVMYSMCCNYSLKTTGHPLTKHMHCAASPAIAQVARYSW